MNYDMLREDEDFHLWHSYAPKDSQYVRYAESDPSLIAAGFKISDVYYSFCNARCSLMNAGVDNFGDISSNDEFSKKYAKSHFLTYAVLEYSICLDISWQVVWAYIQPSSLEYLMKNEYKKMEKECTRESVHSQLNCIISQGGNGALKAKKIKEVLIDFESDDDISNLRGLYNSLKHHGMIHFEGLGENWSSLMATVSNEQITVLSRTSYSIEKIEESLFNYHYKFKEYFYKIINEIIPKGYLDNTVNMADYISATIKMHKALKK